MGDRTGIEWTDATWTPIRARLLADTAQVGWHCEHVSEGCRNCYAEAMNRRLGTGLDFKPGHRRDVEIILDEKLLLQPLRWRRPRLIFVCSMTDIGADFVTDAMLDRMFATMALCPQHTFQVLTKRMARMRAYLSDPARRAAIDLAGQIESVPFAEQRGLLGWTLERWPLPNVWLGTSVEDQAAADARIPELLATPAAVRFLSCEPLLGPVDLEPWLDPDKACQGCDDGEGYGNRCSRDDIPRNEQCPFKRAVQVVTEHGPFSADGEPAAVTAEVRRIDWVIGGGESGKDARPMHPAAPRGLRDQCAAAGVPFTFKQWGEWRPAPEIIQASGRSFHRFADGAWSQRIGKKAAGRLLDGVQHDGRPA